MEYHLRAEQYPEVLVLDIAYLHRARGAFYGHVAQATTLMGCTAAHFMTILRVLCKAG